MRIAGAVLLVATLAVAQATASSHSSPIPMWGEIVGQVPASLSAVLATDTGDVVATARASLASVVGRVFYSLEWPAEVVVPASKRAKGGLSIGFRLDGGDVEASFPIAAGAKLPAVLDLREGRLSPPSVEHLMARVELGDTGDLTFTSALANDAADDAPGRLRWQEDGGARRGPGSPLDLDARSVTSARLTQSVPEGERPPSAWSVTWESRDRSAPIAFARAALMRPASTLADDPSGNAARIEPVAGRLPLSDESLELLPGQYLELALEYTGTDGAAAATSLVSRSLGSSGTTTGGYSMACAVLTPLAGGRLWASCRWFVERRAVLEAPCVRAGPAPLPGPWKLHYLGVSERYSGGGDF